MTIKISETPPTKTPVDLSLTNWNGKETNQRNTANCYIIRCEGAYKIPLVYGNAIKNGKINVESFYTKGNATDFQDSYGVPFTASSSPFISRHAAAQGKSIASAELLWNDGKSIICNLSVDGYFLNFDVESFSPCNALVAVRDNDGTILWSWHLWLTDTNLTPKIITNADGVDFKVMPCNLGWNGWTADGKPTSPYYQWGRKDPFIANEEPSDAGNISYKSVSGGLKQYVSHQNPKTFYHSRNSYSWTTDKYTYFWDSKMNGNSIDQKVTKTIYDPCPVGWCVPQYNTFTGLSTGNTTVADNGRYCTTKAGTQDLYIPFAGCRYYYSGSVFIIGDYGYCWLSTPCNVFRGHLLDVGRNGLDPRDYCDRGYGYSVRPVLSE